MSGTTNTENDEDDIHDDDDEDEDDTKTGENGGAVINTETMNGILEMLKHAGVSTEDLEQKKHAFWDTQVRISCECGESVRLDPRKWVQSVGRFCSSISTWTHKYPSLIFSFSPRSIS